MQEGALDSIQFNPLQRLSLPIVIYFAFKKRVHISVETNPQRVEDCCFAGHVVADQQVYAGLEVDLEVGKAAEVLGGKGLDVHGDDVARERVSLKKARHRAEAGAGRSAKSHRSETTQPGAAGNGHLAEGAGG